MYAVKLNKTSVQLTLCRLQIKTLYKSTRAAVDQI